MAPIISQSASFVQLTRMGYAQIMKTPEFFEAERGAEQALEFEKLSALYKFAKEREAAVGRIREKDFLDDYGATVVKHDRKYVKKRKQDSEEDLAKLDARERYQTEEARRLAYIMEVLLQEEGELSEWFGREASTSMASEYDDWKNGVDAIVEFEIEGGAQHLALAVDFTLIHGLLDKIQQIKGDIDAGHAAQVKYFKSGRPGAKPGLENVAKVVVSCDVGTLMEAAVFWKQKASKNKTRSREAREELADHPIQMIVLREIQKQLEMYRVYAETSGKQKFADLYAGDLAIIDAVIDEKEPRLSVNVDEDGAYRKLTRSLDIVFRK